MSNYDVALGIGQDTINAWLRELYEIPFIKSKLRVGNEVLSAQLTGPPTLLMQPPTAQQWQESIKRYGVKVLPANNVFQLQLPHIRLQAIEAQLDFYGTANIGDDGAFEIDLFAMYGRIQDLPQLLIDAVLDFVRTVAFPMLNHYLGLVPRLNWAGWSLADPTLSITDHRVVIAATAAGDTDLTGATWPEQDLFVLARPAFTRQHLSFTRRLEALSATISVHDLGITTHDAMVLVQAVLDFAAAPPTGEGSPNDSSWVDEGLREHLLDALVEGMSDDGHVATRELLHGLAQHTSDEHAGLRALIEARAGDPPRDRAAWEKFLSEVGSLAADG